MYPARQGAGKRGWVDMFRGAVRADMARILDIYARAREFMAKNGNPTQWGDNYPSPELLEEDIDTNRLFVYMVNGRMQAVFAFVLGEDPTYKVIEDEMGIDLDKE